MPPLENTRHEKLCLNLVKGMTATDALIDAGYSPLSAPTHSTEMLKNVKIMARLAELQAAAATNVVFEEAEALELLSETARSPIPVTVSASERTGAIRELREWIRPRSGPVVAIDNRQVQIHVMTQRGADLLTRIGERIEDRGIDAIDGTGQKGLPEGTNEEAEV